MYGMIYLHVAYGMTLFFSQITVIKKPSTTDQVFSHAMDESHPKVKPLRKNFHDFAAMVNSA
jgi:hypothetical protein